MNIPKVLAASALCTSVLFLNQAMAQEDADMPTMNPAEIYTCNYLDGKSRGDLDKVIARWNKWSDNNDPAPYTAWVLSPVFFGPEITFDLAWLGAWPTNDAMGKGLQTWQDKGSQMGAEFFDVFSCDQHTSMAVLPMQPLFEPAETSLVRFLDCKVADGINIPDAVGAHRKFSAYMKSKGSDTSAFAFFSGMGAGETDFDYKIVLANADYPSLSRDAEIYTNGGGWMEAAKTMSGITSCDSARLYKADLVRDGAAQ